MFPALSPRRALVAAAVAVSTFLLPGVAVAAPDPAPALTASEQREIVPAYFYPDLNKSDSQWKKMCSVAAPKSVIIMNPGSGPGKAKDPNYTNVVKYCRDRGHNVIGYVSTRYGKRNPDHVRADINNYLKWYQANGIFLDEMNNNADAPAFGDNPNAGVRKKVKDYYSRLSAHIRLHAADPLGPSQMVVGNPGDVSQAQGPWAFGVVDILVVFEGTAAKYTKWAQPTWVYPGTNRAHAYRFAHLVHGVRSVPVSQEGAIRDRSRKLHAGYVYVTPEIEIRDASGKVTNPLWNELSRFWLTRTRVGQPAVAP